MKIEKTYGQVDPNLFADTDTHTTSLQTIKMSMVEYSQFSHKLSITRRARHQSHPICKPMAVVGGGQFVHLNGEQAKLIDGAEGIKSIIEIDSGNQKPKTKKPTSKKPKQNQKTKWKSKNLDAKNCTLSQIEKAITPTGTKTIIRDAYNRNKYWEVSHNTAPCYHYIVRQVIESRNVIDNKVERTQTGKTRFRKADLLKMFEIN